MALEKQITIDKIEVIEDGSVQVRQITRVMENGTELSASYHRWVLHPGSELTGQEARVVAICNTVWTQETIDAYEAQVSTQQARG